MASTAQRHSLSLLPLLLLLSLFTPSTACNPNDKAALLKIKAHFKNASPFFSWDPKTDCCGKWHDVACSDQGRVASLAIAGADDLVGTIPDAVGDLPFLTNLQIFSLPKLTGPIPYAIARLQSLTDLALSSNNLTGQVPSFLSQLKKLTTLGLSGNSLSGTIPPSLATLPVLNELNLAFNHLTGTIPASFGSFKSLTYLSLENNHLSGPIPKALGHLNILKSLSVSSNKLTGDVSFLFGKSKALEEISINDNRFQFDLSKIDIPKKITVFVISSNQIYGSMPRSLGRPFNSIDVRNNQLCGPIPNGKNLYKPYETYLFENNKCLCGFPLKPCK